MKRLPLLRFKEDGQLHQPTTTRMLRVATTVCIDEDLNCARCGYNLRGAVLEADCSECGTPVSASNQPNLLQLYRATILQRLLTACAFAMATMFYPVVMFVALLVSQATHALGVSMTMTKLRLIMVPFFIGITVTAWLATPFELTPHVTFRWRLMRGLLRTGGVVYIIANLLAAYLEVRFGQRAPHFSMVWVLFLLFALGRWLLMIGIITAMGHHFAELSARLPDDRLARTWRWVWLGLTVSMALMFTGQELQAVLFAWLYPRTGVKGLPPWYTAVAFLTAIPGYGLMVFYFWALLTMNRFRRAVRGLAARA